MRRNQAAHGQVWGGKGGTLWVGPRPKNVGAEAVEGAEGGAGEGGGGAKAMVSRVVASRAGVVRAGEATAWVAKAG